MCSTLIEGPVWYDEDFQPNRVHFRYKIDVWAGDFLSETTLQPKYQFYCNGLKSPQWGLFLETLLLCHIAFEMVN